MVDFLVLGPLEARLPSGPVHLGGARHREILARLLLARGQVVAIDRLITDIWGDDPPRHAIATVRTIVFHLRQVLEPDRPRRTPARVLVTVAPGYAVRAEATAADSWRFEAFTDEATELLGRGRPAEALPLFQQGLRLWRGGPYAEFADAEWARVEITRLTELRVTAREGLATALLGLGRAAEALPDLQALAGEHPLREEGRRLHALALYRAGRQGEALAALREVRTTLRNELGIDPGLPLRTLEAEVHAQVPAPPPPVSVPAPVAETTAHEPLLGRTSEVDTLVRLASAAKAGSGRIALVEGPAGIGKTALARHLLARLRDEGWSTATARCPEVAGAPGGWPWLEVVDLLTVHRRPPPELEELFAAASRPTGTTSVDTATANRFRFCRLLATYLAAVAGDRPLLIVLEDLHLADADTLTPLVEVARLLTDHPVFLIGTFRPAPHHALLAACLADLAGRRPERIQLGGLDAQAIGSLARAAGTHLVDDVLAEQIARRTSGNPFLARELARHIAAHGPEAALRSLPAGIRDVLVQRLAGLPEDVRVLLRKAAVLGDEFDLDLLAAMDDDQGNEPDYDAVLERVETGLATGILDDGTTEGTLRFTHALMHEAVYAEISTPRRTLWHRRAAATLERLQPHNVPALARHHLQAPSARTATSAIRCARMAADQAAGRFAYHEAVRLRTAALTVADRFGSTPRDRLTIVGELLQAHAFLSDKAAMRVLRAEALAPLTELADPALTAHVVMSLDPGNPVLAERRVAPEQAVHLDRVVALLARNLSGLSDEDSELRALLLTKLAIELYGHPDERERDRGRAAAEDAGAIARRIDLSAGTRAEVLIAAHTQAYATPGGLARRTRLAAELVALAQAHGLVVSERLGLLWQLYAAEQRGDLIEAECALSTLDSQLRRFPHPASVARVRWHRAMLLDLADAPDDDVTKAYQAGAQALEDAGVQRADLLLMTVRWCRAYRAGKAAGLLPEYAARYPAWPASPQLFALTLALAGDLDRAREILRTALPAFPDATYELDIALVGLTAIHTDDKDVAEMAYRALLPAADEILGPGACVFVPAGQVLTELAGYLGAS